MPTVLIIVLTIITLIFLVLLVSTVYFYRLGIIRQKSKAILQQSPDLEANRAPDSGDVPLPEIPWVEQQPFEEVDMISFDGLKLRGYYLPAKTSTPRTAILAHGYMGHARSDMALFARFYHERLGYNVLMPDDRGHGASEGGYIGFGWHDRLDYIKWIHYAIKRAGEEASIVLHGISMGGATVLMTSGEPLPPQVKCVISDCAYTSALDILTYQLKRMFNLPSFPLVPLTSLLCKLHAGFSFSEASAIRQVRKTSLPCLFIHGDEDTFVPTAMVHQIYEQCAAPFKKVVLVPGAGHGLAYPTDPAAYERASQDFLARFIP